MEHQPPIDADFRALVEEAKRLSTRPLNAEIRPGSAGSFLVLALTGTSDEGAELRRRLTEFRSARDLTAPFVVVTSSPVEWGPSPGN